MLTHYLCDCINNEQHSYAYRFKDSLYVVISMARQYLCNGCHSFTNHHLTMILLLYVHDVLLLHE